uniref:G protein-coupled receptor 173 n=1 Tax=Eptatretus burgeri TaxID=7764 RepID=A0A8C4QBE2_EPTBU
MANVSDGAGQGSSHLGGETSGLVVPSVGKLASLGLIIFSSLAGNLLLAFHVLKEKSLHRAPYFFLLDLCLADALRAAVCFPFVWAAASRGSVWPYEALGCKIIAFIAVLSAFHSVFVFFCISITRYIAIAHHRFYTKRVTLWTCVAIICTAWTLSVAMAFPPVFDVGTYKFIPDEDQCNFEHRYFKVNDSLGFMLIHNWTFHGPGATGQAAANWIAGFGVFVKGPSLPRGYVATSAWMTYAQSSVNPVVCYLTNRELRRSFWTSLAQCRKTAAIGPFAHRTDNPVAAFQINAGNQP